MSKPVLLVSAAALMDPQGNILLTQRPEGKEMAGLWEFPGGKIHGDETPEEALVREIKEELDITLRIEDLKPLAFASHAYSKFHLLMPLFLCRRWEGQIVAREGQDLTWTTAESLDSYAMPPADLPLIEAVKRAAI